MSQWKHPQKDTMPPDYKNYTYAMSTCQSNMEITSNVFSLV